MDPVQSLDRLVSDGIVDAVVQRIKTGKEAEVFVVRKGDQYLAAKVYKERTARNFKNNVAYKEGRVVRNSRDARALAKNTKYGRNLSESDWMHTEHDALVTLAAAGVRVPKAELFYEDTLLMELVLDAEGQPAPRLIECTMSAEEATAWHRDLVGQAVRMLACDLIHGDLSPYNVLLAWNGPTIIDLPQVIKAAHNTQAEQFLVRDVRNLTEFFARFAPALRSRASDGYAIWRRYSKRDLSPDYFPEDGEGIAARPMDDGRRKHGRSHKAPHRTQQDGAHPAHPHQPRPREHRPAHAPPASGNTAPREHRPAHAPPASGNTAPREHRPAHPGGHHSHRPAAAKGTHAPARPQPPRAPRTAAPEVVRVNRPHTPAKGPGGGGEERPTRFSQHHRHRR